MKMRCAAALAAVLFTFSAGAVSARDLMQQDYSNDEQTLCQPDVFRLCNDYVPDEDRIIACMKQNRTQLSQECRRVFDVGLKKHGK